MTLRTKSSFNDSVTIEDLSPKQAAFVQEYVKLGGKNGSGAPAALAAGYAQGCPAAARVRASELLRNSKILSVLRDELTKKLNAAATLGVNVLIELAENGPPQVRLSAAKELIDRGYGPVVSRNAHVHGVTTVEDLLGMLDEYEETGMIDEEVLEEDK